MISLLIEKIIISAFIALTSISPANNPEILGVNDIEYPYIFIESNYECHNSNQCLDYCEEEISQQGEDYTECIDEFGEDLGYTTATDAAASTAATTMTTMTTNAIFTAIQFPESGNVCETDDQCVSFCSNATLSSDREICQEHGYSIPTITSTTTFELAINPSEVSLLLGDAEDFRPYLSYSDGSNVEISQTEVEWQVINGGGDVTDQGIFYSTQAGSFPNTIMAQYQNHTAYASVTVQEPESTLYHEESATAQEETPEVYITEPEDTYSSSTSTDDYQHENEQITENTTEVEHNTEDLDIDNLINEYYPDTQTTQVTESSSTNQIADTKTITEDKTKEGAETTSNSYTTPTSHLIPIAVDFLAKLKGEAKEEDVVKPVPMFQNLNQKVKNCLQSNLTEHQYRLFITNQNTEQLLKNTSTKKTITRCMQLKNIPELTNETKACLQTSLGETRFNQLYRAKDKPNSIEKIKINSCNSTPNLVTYNQDSQNDPITSTCLKLNLGTERYNQIEENPQSITSEEINNSRNCYNLATNIAKPPLVINSPDNTSQDCLKQIIGEKQYQQIIQGKKQPTETQIQQAQQCISQKISLDSVILPQEPTNVPYLTKSTDLHIQNIESQKSEQYDVLGISGQSTPNSVVDIYFYSTPIIVTTMSDANGNWNYELSYHLPKGNHHAYTVVHQPEKGLVRSEVFEFGVAYAQEDISSPPELMIVTPEKKAPTQIIFISISGLIVLAGISTLLFTFRHRLEGTEISLKKKEKPITMNFTAIDQQLQNKDKKTW